MLGARPARRQFSAHSAAILSWALTLLLLSSCAQQATTRSTQAEILPKPMRGETNSQLIAEFENKIAEALLSRHQLVQAHETQQTLFQPQQTSKITLSQREDLDADIEKLSQLLEQLKDVNQTVLNPKNKRAIRMHKHQLARLKHQLIEKRLATTDQLGSRYTGLIAYYTAQQKSTRSFLIEAKETIQKNKKEIDKIRRELGSENLASPLLSDLSHDETLFLSDSPADKHLYLNLISDLIATASAKFTEVIAPPADAPMEVHASTQNHSGTARFSYSPAQISSGNASILRINLQDMQKLPLYEAEARSFIFGIPGMHLLYISSLNNQSNTHTTTTFTLSDVPAFTLGWGLYTANLAREHDLYGSPYGELGSLMMENRQASILVSDINLNQKTWTDAQAVEFLQKEGFQTLQDARSVVEEAHRSPGAQTSAFSGFLAFRALRSKSEKRLGKSFNLFKFHRQILSSGPLPIYLIEEDVEIWLNNISKNTQGQQNSRQ
jgi:uncharacterized protein (DUF885 family)